MRLSRLMTALLPIVILLETGDAYANFGLGPCCSGAPCGIVPCDSSCAGQAITQMGSSVSAAINSLRSAHQRQTNATNDATKAVNGLSKSLINSLNKENQDVLRGLDAATSRIEASVLSFIPTKERLTDHQLNSLKATIQSYFVGSSSADSTRTLGDIAQPVSGELAPERAKEIASLVERRAQISARLVSDFYKYVSDESIAKSGSGAQLSEKLYLDLKKFNGASALIHANILTKEQEQFYQRLLAYTASPEPAKASKDDLSSEAQALLDRRHSIKTSIIFAALSSALSSRIATSDKSWDGIYEDTETTKEGLISLTETLRADVDDRLTNPGYWGAIKTLTSAGVARELVYLNSTNSVLRNLEYDLKSQSTSMIALMGLTDAPQ